MSFITTDNIVFLALGAAFLAESVSLLRIIYAKHSLTAFMGKAQWDFTSSWATTLTAVGALLTTLLGTQQTSLLPYTALSLFFGLLVLLAPVIYSTTGDMRTIHTDGKEISKQYQGRLWGFLIACFFTLWGVFGQLGTIFPLLQTLTGPAASPSAIKLPLLFPQTISMFFQVILWIAVAVVFLYAIRSVYWITWTQVSDEAQTARRKRLSQAHLFSEAQVTRETLPSREKTAESSVIDERSAKRIPTSELQPELPNWSLL